MANNFCAKKRKKRQIIDEKWEKSATTFGRRSMETSAVAQKTK